MNIEKNAQNKPFDNYSRGGERHVDIKKKSLETMEELKKIKLPEKEQNIDLGAQLREELDAELGEFTPEIIKAVANNVRSRFEAIEGTRKKYQAQGITGESLENLMDIAKNEALMASGVTNEIQVANEALESSEIQRGKQILNAAIEHLNSL